jgi:hypothetical protein
LKAHGVKQFCVGKDTKRRAFGGVKAHVEIKIRLKRIPDGGLHQILQEFAQKTEGWHFPKVRSEEYQQHQGSSAGFADCLGKRALEPSAVAVANLDSKHPNTFRVPNIVPRDCSSLTLDQYNTIGLAFANDFRNWLQGSQFFGNVEVIGPTKTLADIIPGEKGRRFFEAWLYSPTPTSHPSDLYQLDRFICHLFRHRGATRTWEIGHYLTEDRGWRPETARWVVARIETGLELLRVDRKFH